MAIFKKKKQRRSRKDLKAVIDKRKAGEALDFEEDETTDVIDLTLAKFEKNAKKCQQKVRDSADALRTLRMPSKGPTEEAG